MAWLSGWNYRQAITISGAAGAGTGYTVRLAIGESAGASGYDFHLYGHSAKFPTGKNDGGDLRFTQSDGTTLENFWVEKVDGTSPNRTAIVWVKVSADLGTNQTIYCYYGNSSATSASDPSNIGLLFDDFDGASGSTPNSSLWVVEKKGDTNAIVELDGASSLRLAPQPQVISSANIKSVSTFSPGFAVEVLRKITDDNYVDFSVGDGTVLPEGGGTTNWWHTVLANGYFFKQQSLTNHRIMVTDLTGATTYLVYTLNSIGSVGVWERHTYRVDSGGLHSWNIAGTELSMTTADTTYSGPFYLLFTQGMYSTAGYGGESYYDWIMVRKYVNPEPTFSSVGTEESSGVTPSAPESNLLLGIAL